MCYSPRVKENLESLEIYYEGYPDKSTYVHLETRKNAWCYKRSDRLNAYLAKCYENKAQNLGLSDKDIIEIFKKDA